MPIVQVQKDKFVELFEKQTIIGPDGVQYPWNIISNWTDKDLAAINVYRVARASPPDGYQIKHGTTPTFEWNKKSGNIDQVLETEKIPQTPPPDTKKYVAPPLMAQQNLSLDEFRSLAMEHIDEKSAKLRETTNPVILFDQEQKRLEAERFLDDPATKPDMKKYPYLNAAWETKVDGKTATAIAKKWIKRSEETRIKNAKFDADRIKAKATIRTSEDRGNIRYLVDNFGQ